MSKRFLLLVFLMPIQLFWSLGLKAQDSIRLDFSNNYQKVAWFGSTKQPLRAILMNNQLGWSGAFGYAEAAPSSPSQVPDREKGYGFFSYGNRKVGKFMIEGEFSYLNERPDSVGWKQTRNISSLPYYFANIRRGNWINDLFQARVNVATTLLRERIYFGIGADYKLEQHNRGNDPRPRISYFNLDLKGQLGIRLGTNHLVSVFAGQGRATEIGNVRNYNASNDSFGRLDYNLYTIMGFGSFNLLRRPRYEIKQQNESYGLGYYYQSSSWKIFNEFEFRRSMETFLRQGSATEQAEDSKIGDYDLLILENSLFIERQFDPQRSILGNFKFSSLDGRDFNYLFSGFNYQYLGRSIHAEILYRYGKQVFGIHLSNWSEEKEDFNASHQMAYSQGETAFSYNKKWEINSEWDIILEARYELGFNLSANLSVPDFQRNIFTESVALPMLHWNSREYMGLQAKVQVQKYFQKNIFAPFVQARIRNLTGESAQLFQEQIESQLRFGINFIH